MKKIVSALVLLTGFLCVSAQTGGQTSPPKKKVIFTPTAPNINQPTDLSGALRPVLSAEYDDDSLSISISDYWGNVGVTILSSFPHSVMDDTETTVSYHVRMDFPISGYIKGRTYQIYIILEDDEVYCGDLS